ncbi:SulP family inorganic anion transporter [Streptomyces sp. NPDC059578]|uniref:SulP family inorganic anion transporter n=1 Tax=Streptomyces sp. NPDC059578 TaxID=3346874 RepID=UPI0036D0705C
MSSKRTRPGAGRHARRSGGSTAGDPSGSLSPAALGADLMASVVVFLVALPLCIGVAAASGVPVSLGIISGIVGGLVVGFLPGSTFQVSGPAAGLAVLVLEFTTEHGVGLLGVVVLVSGVLQMALGLLKLGRVFQSISLSVVQGMLAGIGLPLILSQTYALVDSKQLGTALKNIGGLPDLVADVLGDSRKGAALALGVMAVVICFLWKKVPDPLGKVPAPLIAVVLGSAVAALPGFDVKKVQVGNLLDAVDFVGLADFHGLTDPKVLTMVITFTVIASAESLFSAAAVDRMHTGPRTKYNAELFSQGVGNTLCGFLGALPMTAVIVRSAANLQAGATTKVSRILHGAWLLGFGLLLPGLLGLIPVTILAGVLLHAGWKLFNPPSFVKMWRTDRGEGLVMFVTTGAIVVTDLLDGVIGGLAVAIVLTALRMSHLSVRRVSDGDATRLVLRGNATFLRLIRLIRALDSVAGEQRVVVDARAVTHLDLACRAQIEEWAEQRRKSGAEHVEVLLPGEEPAAEAGPPADGQADGTGSRAGDFIAGSEAPAAGQPWPAEQPVTSTPYGAPAGSGAAPPQAPVHGYAPGSAHEAAPARPHPYAQPHPGMGGQVYGRAAYQQHAVQHAQVHLAHPAHSHRWQGPLESQAAAPFQEYRHEEPMPRGGPGEEHGGGPAHFPLHPDDPYPSDGGDGGWTDPRYGGGQPG